MHVVFGVDVLQFIYNFLGECESTMFSFKMSLHSTLRYRAFNYMKVSLLEGTVRGIMLMVFFIG